MCKGSKDQCHGQTTAGDCCTEVRCSCVRNGDEYASEERFSCGIWYPAKSTGYAVGGC